jgi:hypothetical protein
MTLSEFYEREYAFEYKNSLALHEVRIAIQWKYIMNADPEKPIEKQVPELHEIIPLWMLGDKIKQEEEIEVLPIEQRKTAQEMLDEFNF